VANERDLKNHFEAILGRELAGGFGGEVALRETVGLYSVENDSHTCPSRKPETIYRFDFFRVPPHAG
jgi:hypothetical protein